MYAQISAPDTVCINAPVDFSTTYSAHSYAWSFGGAQLSSRTPGNASHLHAGITGASYPACAVMRFENGNYYGFVVNTKTGHIIRLDFGTNPNSIPSSNDLGNFGVINSGFSQCIDIVKDDTAWYGFLPDGIKLARLDFGNSLANTPTATSMDFRGYIEWGKQFNVKKIGNQWIGFCANYNSHNIARFDFGTSLTNTPTPYILPTHNMLSGPSYFCIYQSSYGWHMFVTNLGNYKLIRYDFGNSLMNNNPTATFLRTVGYGNDHPRGINIVEDCNGFYGLLVSEDTKFYQLDFRNNIYSVPGLNYLGPLTTGSGLTLLSEYWYNDTLYFMSSSFTSHAVFRLPVGSIPTGSTINYNPAPVQHTFNTKGVYEVTLMCDEGSAFSGRTFCKQIVVADTPLLAIVFSGDTLTATGGHGTNYQWSLDGIDIPGAINVSYTPVKSGTYTVTCLLNGGCTAKGNYIHFMNSVSNIDNDSISVYPNPASGKIIIRIDGMNNKVVFSLYNMLGQAVLQKAAIADDKATIHSVDVSTLPAGVYHLSVVGDDAVRSMHNIVLQ